MGKELQKEVELRYTALLERLAADALKGMGKETMRWAKDGIASALGKVLSALGITGLYKNFALLRSINTIVFGTADNPQENPLGAIGIPFTSPKELERRMRELEKVVRERLSKSDTAVPPNVEEGLVAARGRLIALNRRHGNVVKKLTTIADAADIDAVNDESMMAAMRKEYKSAENHYASLRNITGAFRDYTLAVIYLLECGDKSTRLLGTAAHGALDVAWKGIDPAADGVAKRISKRVFGE